MSAMLEEMAVCDWHPTAELLVNNTVTEATHDLTCEHDLEGNILAVNAAVARALEIPAHRLRTMNLRDMVSAGDRAMVDRYLLDIRRDGAAEGLLHVRTATGRRRVWQYQNAVARAADGTSIVRGLASDVTDRELALRALRSSERQLRSIIENVSDIIGIVDGSGRLQYHSPSTERMLGYPSQELTGCRLSELVHAEDVHRTDLFFEEQSVPGAPTRTIDLRVRHCDGTWRWLSVVASTVARTGEPTSIVINARDVTERMLLEAQLEQANRLNSLGKLAATVAHEFNNVLMGIQPFADLMRRPEVLPSTIEKAAQHIANSIVRGKRVALDILRFTNPAKPSLEPVDVADWWRQLAPEMHASVGNRIHLETSFSGTLTMLGDAAQLSQVFSNLIGNARDAMPDGGTLRVTARSGRPGETFLFGLVAHPERFICFTVADTGTGMPENVLRHVFDPLFTTKANGGTGLGLAVVHQAVNAHGGHVFAESTAGIGSTFHLFIPATEAAGVAPVTPPASRMELVCERVLLVDDEPSIVEGLADLLADYGLAVQVAGTGEAAIVVARDFRPDVAVLDIKLPDMSGLEVATRLRAENPEVRILFASGHGAAAAAPFQNERTAFIQKPFDIDALIAAIVELDKGASDEGKPV